MKTSQEIRRENLELLIKEAGTARALFELSGVPAPYISQLRNQVKNDSGKIRTMGDDTARKLERSMQKAEGWLDTDHSAAVSGDLAGEVAELTRMFTTFDADARKTVLDSVRGIFNGKQPANAAAIAAERAKRLAALGKLDFSHVPGRKKPNAKRKPNAL